MSARIYAPTVEQRKEALKIAERLRPKKWLFKFGLYPTAFISFAWIRSGFTFPFQFDALDIGLALIIATGVEIYQFATKIDKARLHTWLQEEDSKALGPLQYRLSEAGFEWWQHGEHELQEWDRFEKFKLTDELLILVLEGGAYWVVPRREVGEANIAVIVERLEDGGVREIAGSTVQTVPQYSSS